MNQAIKKPPINKIVEKQKDNIPGDKIQKEISEYLGVPAWSSVLKTYRNFADLSQAALARKMNVSRQYMSKLEKGKGTIGKTQAKEFQKILNIPNYTILLED